MNEWKTIDSAPKGPPNEWGDGPRILGWDGDLISIIYWAPFHREWRGEADLYDDGESVVHHAGWLPTRWQPPPEPPKKP